MEKTTATKKAAKTKAKEEVSNSLTSSFVFMDDTRKILDVSMATSKNVILYGKGGYGKSEFTEAYLKENGIEPYVITMGSGMTTDRLFGGVDIAEFNRSGKIEYLIDNSFMNNEFVIFEELFDAPDFILEQLKDILSSGVFRNGGQKFDIKTKNIICCTNKTREEFAKNNSLKALMERFPLEWEVKWNDHNKITYEKLLTARFGSADPMLTYILEEYAKAGQTISPRIAIVAAEVMATCGPDCLTMIADFAGKPKTLKDSMAKFKSFLQVGEKVKALKSLETEFNSIEVVNGESYKLAQATNGKIFKVLTELKAIKADESLVATTTKATKDFEAIYEKNKKTLDVAIKVDPSLHEL